MVQLRTVKINAAQLDVLLAPFRFRLRHIYYSPQSVEINFSAPDSPKVHSLGETLLNICIPWAKRHGYGFSVYHPKTEGFILTFRKFDYILTQ